MRDSQDPLATVLPCANNLEREGQRALPLAFRSRIFLHLDIQPRAARRPKLEHGTIVRTALCVATISVASLIAFSQTKVAEQPPSEIRGKLRHSPVSPIGPMMLTTAASNPAVTSDATYLYVVENHRIYKLRKSDLHTETVATLSERTDRAVRSRPGTKKSAAKRTARKKTKTQEP